MIEADGLLKRFGPVLAADMVSFAVQRGEVVAMLGPNGAGKSTTLRMIAGCLEPDAGRASIAGRDSAMRRRDAQRHLGYLPEGAPAYPSMTPRGFVRFHLRARGFSGRDLHHAEGHALERAHLGSYADRAIGGLSKGYRRRAALAAAIAHDPPALILDEPTDGLDPNQKDAVRDLVLEMAPKKAILISTHRLDEVEAMCSRAIVIAGGRVLADESPSALARRGPGGTLADAFRTLTSADLKAEEAVNAQLAEPREAAP